MQPLHSFSSQDCLQKVPAAVSSNASLNSGIGATGRLILIIVKEKNKTYIQSLRLRRICPWAASDYLAVYCTKHIWNHYDTARLTPLERVGRIDKAQTYSILLLCMAGKLSKVLAFNVWIRNFGFLVDFKFKQSKLSCCLTYILNGSNQMGVSPSYQSPHQTQSLIPVVFLQILRDVALDWEFTKKNQSIFVNFWGVIGLVILWPNLNVIDTCFSYHLGRNQFHSWCVHLLISHLSRD